ncbi:PKD domain-containing protein [candidate division KSB1 bacterium]|nr:PKD domain-containing protein [candidate division KSB1 bacterium]
MGHKLNFLVILVLLLFINAFSNDFYPLNHQQITKSQLDDMLPDEFKSSFTQPFVYKFNIYCDGWPDDGSTIIDFFLNQIPAKVIASLSSDDDFYSAIMINGHSVHSDEGWVDVTSYCNSKTLGVIVTPDFMLHSDASGTIWMGCSVSLGNKLEYDLIFHTIDNVSIYAYEVKTTVDIVTENFGYNPITYAKLNELLLNDGAAEFTNHFNQPYIARFELQSGSDIDQAVKIMMNLQQAPSQAIGRGSGESAPQAAIGVEFTKQHNIKTDGFEDIYPYCYTNELYMILNDDPVHFTPGHMILWMGFSVDMGHWLTYQNMPNCLKPELFSVTAYRFTDQVVENVSIITPVNYELAYLKEGDNYYIDRNYYITNIPDTLKNLIWLKTANDDKKNSSNSFITLHLQNDAIVYVAYDHRAVTFPDWLLQNFQNTNRQIQVSDEASPLGLWKKEVSAGSITLGGNLAHEASGAKSNYIVLIDSKEYLPPVALFDFEPQEGTAPLEVFFQDNSTGDITSRFWDFGDGYNSTQHDPTHTYQTSGNFAVTLEVTGPGGSDMKTATVYVYENSPVAEFTADATEGLKPLTVHFTDQSTGAITEWLWDFGDGNMSSAQNPIHIYEKADTFNVSLTVTGPGGNDTKIKEDFIKVSNPTLISDIDSEIPDKFYLSPNFPNPFNSNTCIRFGLSKTCYIELRVYNMSGQLIEKLNTQSLSAGNYTFTWDASPYPSGVYLCKITADDFQAVRKMLYIK